MFNMVIIMFQVNFLTFWFTNNRCNKFNKKEENKHKVITVLTRTEKHQILASEEIIPIVLYIQSQKQIL